MNKKELLSYINNLGDDNEIIFTAESNIYNEIKGSFIDSESGNIVISLKKYEKDLS